MPSSQLSRKLFVAYAVIVTVAVGMCTATLTNSHEQRYLESKWQQLREATWLAIPVLEPDVLTVDSAALQSSVRSLSRRSGIRYTVAGPSGEVLADSKYDSAESVARMENHLLRKEFVQALREGSGQSRRRSPTWGSNFLYFVEKISRKGDVVGFVRAALPAGDVQHEVTAMRPFSVRVGLCVAAFGSAAAFVLARQVVGQIGTLAEAAAAIADGSYPRRIALDSGDELAVLARAIERIKSELGSRESQLRASAERHSKVLEGIVEGVIAVDSDQHVLFANEAAGANLGFDPDNVEGLPLLEAVRSHELRQLATQSLATGEAVFGEIIWPLRKSLLTLDVQATPLAGTPAPGVVLVMHDVTELKRLENLRKQFMANVSHELKTPLSSIKAYTETLLNGALEDRQHARHFLSRIDEQTSRLHELIIDLLSLAKIESGQAALDIAEVSLSKVVAIAVEGYEQRAQACGVQIVNKTIGSNLNVKADEESLLQILNNLIDNAIKYTPARGTITVDCHKVDNDAIIEVTDTGIGIQAEHHSRLFERFYRVDKARSRELGGTGLGLAIVKHLAQAMQGSISVDSEFGKGSTFAVRLPLASV